MENIAKVKSQLEEKKNGIEICQGKIMTLKDRILANQKNIQTLNLGISNQNRLRRNYSKNIEKLEKLQSIMEENSKTIESMTVLQLNEVTKYQRPPEIIQKGLEAIFFLLRGKQLSWEKIRSEISSGTFIKEILRFDLHKVPVEIIEEVKKNYIQTEVWNLKRLKRASVAMGPLGNWLQCQIELADFCQTNEETVSFLHISQAIYTLEHEISIIVEQIEHDNFECIECEQEMEKLEIEAGDLEHELKIMEHNPDKIGKRMSLLNGILLNPEMIAKKLNIIRNSIINEVKKSKLNIFSFGSFFIFRNLKTNSQVFEETIKKTSFYDNNFKNISENSARLQLDNKTFEEIGVMTENIKTIKLLNHNYDYIQSKLTIEKHSEEISRFSVDKINNNKIKSSFLEAEIEKKSSKISIHDIFNLNSIDLNNKMADKMCQTDQFMLLHYLNLTYLKQPHSFWEKYQYERTINLSEGLETTQSQEKIKEIDTIETINHSEANNTSNFEYNRNHFQKKLSHSKKIENQHTQTDFDLIRIYLNENKEFFPQFGSLFNSVETKTDHQTDILEKNKLKTVKKYTISQNDNNELLKIGYEPKNLLATSPLNGNPSMHVNFSQNLIDSKKLTDDRTNNPDLKLYSNSPNRNSIVNKNTSVPLKKFSKYAKIGILFQDYFPTHANQSSLPERLINSSSIQENQQFNQSMNPKWPESLVEKSRINSIPDNLSNFASNPQQQFHSSINKSTEHVKSMKELQDLNKTNIRDN